MAYTPKKFSSMANATLPLDGTENVVLANDRKTTVKAIADHALNRPVTIKTANYTAALVDANTFIRMNLAGANTFTVPPNSDVAFVVGTRLRVSQMGAGATTVVAGVGVTVNCAKTLVLGARYSVAEIVKVDTDEWVLFGDLT